MVMVMVMVMVMMMMMVMVIMMVNPLIVHDSCLLWCSVSSL
jgi:hypothetical protein